MARLSMPHMHKKALSCGLLKRFISVSKEMKQREKINACRLDVVLHFKKDGCAQKNKNKYGVVCCLSFYFSRLRCYLVLFLYNPIDSPLFSLAFVHFKRRRCQCTLLLLCSVR